MILTVMPISGEAPDWTICATDEEIGRLSMVSSTENPLGPFGFAAPSLGRRDVVLASSPALAQVGHRWRGTMGACCLARAPKRVL